MNKYSALLSIIIVFLFISNSIDAQVLVRCGQGNFRCMPFDESALDSIHITDGDCDDPRNIYYPEKLYYRRITLCTDSLIYQTSHDAFDFPYFALEPLSMIHLAGPNAQYLVSYMEPTGEIDPTESADQQNLALLLEIDSITKCVSFDAWVPMGEAHTFQVFTERTFSEDNYIVEIPKSPACGITKTTCYTFPSSDTPIAFNENEFNYISTIDTPLEGRIADVNVKNVSISHTDASYINNVRMVTPLNDFKRLYKQFSSSSPFKCWTPGIDIGFDDAGPLIQPCPAISATTAFSPIDPLLHPRADLQSHGEWELRVSTKSNLFQDGDMLNSWELEVCIVEDICGPYVTSTHTPIPIGPSPETIMSTISIPEEGIVSSMYIPNINLEHTSVGNLKISLKSPQGTTIVLVDQVCGSADNFNMAFDDAALGTISCGPIENSKAQPLGAFSNFIGEQVQGDWALIVEDLVSGDGGQLNSWTVNICTDCKGGYTDANGNLLKGSVPTSYAFNARDDIESQQRIIADSLNQSVAVAYKAGNSILLKKEFEVNQGQTFNALLENCNN